ncbi:MAG: c-type cytochrome [Nitrospiraceae bacterium]|nr:c-type cytochrome [Nitrospiraceae bacterium]
MKRGNSIKLTAILFFLLILLPVHAWPAVNGKALYDQWCSQCHGTDGKGDGYAANFVFPRPRDFTHGTFKHVTVPTGYPPTDADIALIIRNGNPGTTMPAWKGFSGAQVNALVQYIKKFSSPDIWQYPGKPFTIGSPPSESAKLLALGRHWYKKGKCWECHGQEGRGDGTKSWQPRFRDDWHNRIYAADQTAPWDYIDGSSLKDIYTTITAGIGGTPMTSYADTVSDTQRWALAYFVRSEQLKRHLGISLQVSRVKSLPASTSDPLWDKVPYLDIPLAGQIMFSPRNFMPLIDNVRVRGVYTDSAVEIMLEWTCKQPSFFHPAGIANDTVFGPGATPISNATGAGASINTGPSGASALAASVSAPGVSNAVAVIYPDGARLQLPSKITSGAEKPYFFGGDTANPVNIWWWKVSDSGHAVEWNGAGVNTLTEQSRQDVQAIESYKDGRYRLIFKRALNTGDKDDPVLAVGRFVPFSITLYDGRNGEHGDKGSVSSWYYMILIPETPLSVYVLPPVMFIIFLLIGLFLHNALKKGRAT